MGGRLNALALYPFMFKGTVNSSNVSWELESGIYFHGSKLYDEGGYGLLRVYSADNYSLHIDTNFKPFSIYVRAAHGYGEVVDFDWTKIH